MSRLPDQARILPDWPAPPGVRAFVSTRAVGDVKEAAVRSALASTLPAAPVWLKQVHGTRVVDAAEIDSAPATDTPPPQADAAFTRAAGVVCAVMAADCMPVLLAAADGRVVGAAHAGWRGLCAGVIESTLEAMRVPGPQVLAYLGPAIGPQAYEVGDEVREAFLARDAAAEAAFAAVRPGHWMLDLYAVARQRLAACGVTSVHGGGHCTYSEADKFFSFRRDATMRRMVACIWIEA